LRGLSQERREDMVFVVNEAATNSVKHGDGHCTARIWHDGQSVVSEVRSETAGPDVLAGRRRPSPDALSGRGLWLINQVCDLVELRSSEAGMTLRMHVR
jgi:anti-sigma regulatory factor (Ser/Thr protein kinase)